MLNKIITKNIDKLSKNTKISKAYIKNNKIKVETFKFFSIIYYFNKEKKLTKTTTPLKKYMPKLKKK